MLPFPRSPFSSGKLLLFRGNETAHRVCYFRAAGQNTLLCRAYGTRRNTVYRFRGKFPSVLRSKRRSFPLKNKSRRPEPDGFFCCRISGSDSLRKQNGNSRKTAWYSLPCLKGTEFCSVLPSAAEAFAFGARRLEKRCLVPSPVAGKIHFFPQGRKGALFFANDESATP